MAELSSPEALTGVVTFLDILGWKGVYDRKKDAVASLTRLVEGLRVRAEKTRGRIFGHCDVKSISDTIAMFTRCDDKEISDAIEIHGELCRWLIPESIEAELPVRGATSFGEFEISENIFVGKAIDEAASWHEQSDWIGVHLTPSAEFVFLPKNAKTSSWTRFTPPTKNRVSWKPFCVDWTRDWKTPEEEIELVKGKFRRLGPIVPEITAKFTNTLEFIEEMRSRRSSPVKPHVAKSSSGHFSARPLKTR